MAGGHSRAASSSSSRHPLLLLLFSLAACRADDFTVKFWVQVDAETQDTFTVTVREKKAPMAAARFRAMVADGFFDGNSFFRVLTGYVVQWGISGNVTKQHEWDARGPLRDERAIAEPDWNMRGTIAFVTTGPNTRGTQLFVNYDDNNPLDAKGVGNAPVPFGRVVQGMGTLSAVYAGYRERPKASSIRARGDAYLQTEFPKLSYIIRAQQVAFVEEPFALSKNQWGFVMTILLIAVVGACCAGGRYLSQKALAGIKDPVHADDDDFRPREDGDDSDLSGDDETQGIERPL